MSGLPAQSHFCTHVGVSSSFARKDATDVANIAAVEHKGAVVFTKVNPHRVTVGADDRNAGYRRHSAAVYRGGEGQCGQGRQGAAAATH